MTAIRVLVVDDSSVMRKMVARSLRQSGLDVVEVFEASNGEEGLESLRKNKINLILSDINMPVMDGLEFLRRVKAENLSQNAPILMITTEGGESHVSEAVLNGASGYLRKPFIPDHVRDRILPLLEAK